MDVAERVLPRGVTTRVRALARRHLKGDEDLPVYLVCFVLPLFVLLWAIGRCMRRAEARVCYAADYSPHDDSNGDTSGNSSSSSDSDSSSGSNSDDDDRDEMDLRTLQTTPLLRRRRTAATAAAVTTTTTNGVRHSGRAVG